MKTKKMNTRFNSIQINWFVVFISLVIIPFVTIACDDDDKDETQVQETNTIVDIAVSDATFSILVEALTKADLVSTLNGVTEYTVFAPTNDAFEDLLADLGVNSLDDISTDDLTEILLYHVVSGSNLSSSLSTGYYSSVSEKQDGYYYSIYFSSDDLMINGSVNISSADIVADNGVIHVVDKVMLPPSITDHAIANDDLSSLTAAVVKAELATVLDDDTNNFTVFAPTNDAFSTFLSDLGLTLDDLTQEDLTPILLYHVVDAFVPSVDVASGYVSSLSTYQENYTSIHIDATDGVVLNGLASVVLTDVVATNGIIHVINGVISPGTVVDVAINNSVFSYLVEAVLKAELAETLSGDGPFTVFAPTDAAFEDLFTALEVSGIDEIDTETLTSVLLAHVVSGNIRSSDLSNGTVQTLNEDKSITIDISDGVTIDEDIHVIVADVQATNGVVHAIDKVIVP
jgi:transforming growth factor-beta-induced protein